MELLLERFWLSDLSTIGNMYIDGRFECYTLEDTYRDGAEKIDGKTCIPNGSYPITINRSPKFKRALPLLLNVPNFEGVRIHPGNKPSDTEGCILVGKEKGIDIVMRSKEAFDPLFEKMLEAFYAKQQLSIIISLGGRESI